MTPRDVDPSTKACFNLVDEPWIPVLDRCGRAKRVGIRQALTEAGSIRQIAASNPMDNVALLRFLLAVLMWCKLGLSETDRQSLDGAAGIREKWLNEKLGTARQPKPAFNLLGDHKRFYQDASLLMMCKESRPIADLLVEFPGADSVNHMRHVVHDGSYGFCPACCALGILRLSVWAPANKYYPASVNPGSAAYAIAEQKTLLLTLIANMPNEAARAEQAPWLSDQPPLSPGPVAFLAWRPRKLWLNVADERGTCANCGQSGVLVDSLCNERGWPTPKTEGRLKKFWEGDPHLLADGEPISLPGLGGSAAVHSSRFWRDSIRLSGNRVGRVVAMGPVVNKFVFQDAVAVRLPSSSVRGRVELSGACGDRLRWTLKKATPNPDRQHPEINAAVVLMTPDTEARIRAALNESEATPDDTAFLKEVYQPLVEQVIASTARGSPLRRREARARAQSALDQALKKATALPTPAAAGARDGGAATPSGATPSKPRRRRKKKGGGA